VDYAPTEVRKQIAKLLPLKAKPWAGMSGEKTPFADFVVQPVHVSTALRLHEQAHKDAGYGSVPAVQRDAEAGVRAQKHRGMGCLLAMILCQEEGEVRERPVALDNPNKEVLMALNEFVKVQTEALNAKKVCQRHAAPSGAGCPCVAEFCFNRRSRSSSTSTLGQRKWAWATFSRRMPCPPKKAW
jgi:hypothetical protein